MNSDNSVQYTPVDESNLPEPRETSNISQPNRKYYHERLSENVDEVSLPEWSCGLQAYLLDRTRPFAKQAYNIFYR